MVIDIASYLQATSREVISRSKDGKTLRSVVLSRDYATDMADLWDAVTNIDRIPRWFLPITGELKLGGRYQFQGNAGGEVLECDPISHFYITWEFGGGVTWVDVRLSEVAGGTRLVLEHMADSIDDEMWKQFGPGAVGIGWEGGLFGLYRHLAGGAPMTPEEGMAWMLSDEGKAFTRASSEAWIQASIAFGTPEEEARAAGARTTAAYTGEAAPE